MKKRDNVLVLGEPESAADVARRLGEAGEYGAIVAASSVAVEAGPELAASIDLSARSAGRQMASLLARIEPGVLVYLGLPHAPVDEPGGEDATTAAVAALSAAVRRWNEHGGNLRTVVALSSTAVYGVARSSPLLFAEAFAGEPDEPEPSSVCARWAQSLRTAEATLRELCATVGARLCTLRAAPIVGGPIQSTLGRYLASPLPVRVLGYDPLMQVLHYHDLLSALVAAVEIGAAGVLNIVGRGVTPLSRLTASAGVLAPPLPAMLARPLVARTIGTARLRWRSVAEGRRAVQILGLTPRLSPAEAVGG